MISPSRIRRRPPSAQFRAVNHVIVNECRAVQQFHDGRAYSYADVEQETYEELLEAESAGRYFNSCVKSAYDTTRLELRP